MTDEFEYRVEFELSDGYRIVTTFMGPYEVAANLASDIKQSVLDGSLRVFVTTRLKEVQHHGEA